MCFVRVQVYLEDALGERVWVDRQDCKLFVDNILTAFNTKIPPSSMLQSEVGKSEQTASAGEYLQSTATSFSDERTFRMRRTRSKAAALVVEENHRNGTLIGIM